VQMLFATYCHLVAKLLVLLKATGDWGDRLEHIACTNFSKFSLLDWAILGRTHAKIAC